VFRNNLWQLMATYPFAESNVDPEILFVALALFELRPTELVEAVTFPIMVIVPAELDVTPAETFPAVRLPVIVTEPVDRLATAAEVFVEAIANAFPTITTVPVEALATPYVLVDVPPVALPVRFKVPEEALLMPTAFTPPFVPTTVPVTLRVPVPVIEIPCDPAGLDDVTFPTTEATAGEFAENIRPAVVPAKISAVSV
jgi:hypothetical protein